MKKLLKGKHLWNLILLFITILVIWFMSPLVNFLGTAPFTSILMRSIFIIFLIIPYFAKIISLLIKKLLAKIKIPINSEIYKRKDRPPILSGTQKDSNLKILKEIFLKNIYRKHHLKKSFWYFILGSEKSGKSNTIKNSGLSFHKQQQINYSTLTEQQAMLINNWEFFFHANAVIVDIKQPSLVMQQIKNNNYWLTLQLFLKKYRRQKIINGIIFTCNVYEYLIDKDKKSYHKRIKLLFEELNEQFSMPIPVYFVFTHCDLIAGFSQFFHKLDKKQQEQVLGFTFPLNYSQDAISLVNHFKVSYQELIQNLHAQLLWLLEHEQDKDNASLIICFTEQLNSFYACFEQLLIEVFSIDRTNRDATTQLRGIYFCSTLQQGKAYDFQLANMAKQFQLEATFHHKQLNQKNSLFLKDLFTTIIFPEAVLVGETRLSQKRKIIIRRSSYLAMPFIVILGTWSILTGYIQNKQNLAATAVNLQNYQQTAKQLSTKDLTLADTLPTLNAFQEAISIYQTTSHKLLVYALFYEPWIIEHYFHYTMQQLLTTIFMPRVAARLEALLSNDSENNDLLYNQLKGYLTFGTTPINKPAWLKSTMLYDFNYSFSQQPLIEDQLSYYLTLALKTSIPKLPLNQLLIDKIRNRLTNTLPAERAYNLLLKIVSNDDSGPIDFATQLGEPFNDIFTITGKSSSIPALYTVLGYKNLFLPNFMNTITQIINNNWVLGIDKAQSLEAKNNMISQLNILYGNNYLHSWQNLLNNFHIVKFQDLTQAVNILNLLTSDQSPITPILQTVYQNTATINIKHINIAEQFSALNMITIKKDQQKIMQNMLTDFSQLRIYLNGINDATDIPQAEFQAVLAYLQDTTGKNPLHQLQTLAKQAPIPLNNWLDDIASNSLALLFAGAQQVIANAWQQNVLPIYESNLQNRYPFNTAANTQVSLDDFSHYFSTNGILAQFFQQYLKAFVNTNTQPWTWYLSPDQTINLDNRILQTFSYTAHIRNSYFTDSTNSINLTFSIEPLTLDKQSASVNLELGNQQLIYQHGPTISYLWQWPIANNIPQAKIIFTDFQGNNYVSTFSGPWAWFKLLASGNLHVGNIPNSCVFTILLNGHQASFLLVSNKDMDFWNLKLLHNFQLPNTVQ